MRDSYVEAIRRYSKLFEWSYKKEALLEGELAITPVGHDIIKEKAFQNCMKRPKVILEVMILKKS